LRFIIKIHAEAQIHEHHNW